MGVGLVRSLQPPDILWIRWRVYNFIANTSKWVLFRPPSDAYVRSFLYLLYTLIKLYYTKALSDQASSLAPDWILLLWGPRIPVYSRDSTTTFQNLDWWIKKWRFGRVTLKHVEYHVRNELPVQVRCAILDAWGWCTGTTQRDGVGREEGGGFRMGNTCMPVVDSFWYLAKLIQLCKV